MQQRTLGDTLAASTNTSRQGPIFRRATGHALS